MSSSTPTPADPAATTTAAAAPSTALKPTSEIQYIPYDPARESHYVPLIRQLISRDLSEPYSIYVYRYFLYQWGRLCFMVDPSYLIPSGRLDFVSG